MPIQFNPEQESAINGRDCDMLVSAAAGSGKTAVLIERIVRMILSEERPVSVDRLLVVTFTNAAAQELRGRLSAELNRRLTESPGEHVRRQLLMLGEAHISTIHSFCMSVIKRYFSVIGSDPNPRTLDGAEAAILLGDCCDELFGLCYSAGYARDLVMAHSDAAETARLLSEFRSEDAEALFVELLPGEDFCEAVRLYDNNPALFNEYMSGKGRIAGFRDLYEAICVKIKDDELKDAVINLYLKLQSEANPADWLNRAVSQYDVSGGELNQCEWFKLIREKAWYLLSELNECLNAMTGAAAYIGFKPKNLELCQAAAVELNQHMELFTADFGAFTDKLRTFERPAIRLESVKETDEPQKLENRDRLEDARDSFKETLDELKHLFRNPIEDSLSDMAAAKPFAETLAALCLALGTRYADKKRELGVIDFSDYEHMCLRILREGGDSVLSELRDNYAEIFIDEYQDTNPVQEEILSMVSGRPNRFMVGDLKQSIYRFRLASPDIFREKYRNFGQDGLQRRVDLRSNFRSRSNVIASVNYIFRQIMSEELGETEYDGQTCLKYGAAYYDTVEADSPETELILIDNSHNKERGDEEAVELEKDELEAKAISRRIAELLGLTGSGGTMRVFDGEGKNRPLAPCDIAVLRKSVGKVADIFARELTVYGIGLVCVSPAQSSFAESELELCLSWLEIIDNPRQDIPLAAVLYSVSGGFSEDELVVMRRAGGDRLYDSLNIYINSHDDSLSDRLSEFEKKLQAYREALNFMPLADFILMIQKENGLIDTAGVMPGCDIRLAGLKGLCTAAASWEAAGRGGLFGFTDYYARMREGGAAQKDQQAGSDCVRLMTIHGSKGLEFPVCFVGGLGAKFNTRDGSGKLLSHSKLGLGINLFNKDDRTSRPVLIKEAIKEKLLREGLSEEMRNLYVALTRAKEKLILVGSCPELENGKFDKLAIQPERPGEAPLGKAKLLRRRSFLGWIIPCVMRHRDFDLAERDEGAVYDDMSRWKFSAVSALDARGYLPINSSSENVSRDKQERDSAVYSSEPRVAVLRERLNFAYPFSHLTQIPSKLSITEIKRLGAQEDENAASLYPIEAAGLRNITKRGGVSAARRGTLIHLMMEKLDFRREYSLSQLAGLRAELCERGFITNEESGAIDLEKIARFLSSPTAERLRRADYIAKEQKFVIALAPKEVLPEWAGIDEETILVHGMIDLVYYIGGESFILDYKTDKAPPEGSSALFEKYRVQLSLYSKAVELDTGKKVKGVALYLFDTDDIMVL